MKIEQRIESFSNSRKIYFEKQILSYNTYLLNKDILDIGSNIGLISLAICNNLKYKSIHLFEPISNNVGVGNINEEKILYSSKDDNIGWNTFLKKDLLQNDIFINKMD